MRREADIYRHLGLAYVVPEMREDAGEIEAAAAGTLPGQPLDLGNHLARLDRLTVAVMRRDHRGRIELTERLERHFELQEVDVSLDPVLMLRYGQRIPVVEVEGEELSEYVVEEAALRERLDRVGPG